MGSYQSSYPDAFNTNNQNFTIKSNFINKFITSKQLNTYRIHIPSFVISIQFELKQNIYHIFYLNSEHFYLYILNLF